VENVVVVVEGQALVEEWELKKNFRRKRALVFRVL
jgi:hypothetical protein